MTDSKQIHNKFEVLTGREQIRRRPQMWIGSMDPVTKSMFMVEDEKIALKDVSFIPAFRKICDEILDNALDALIQHRNSAGNIKVKMDDESVYIEDDGPGIPVVKKQLSEAEEKSLPKEEAEKIKKSYIPEIAWTRLFSGSNFQDGADKTTIGAHGLGSKCTSIFSVKFIGQTDDGKNRCVVKAVNGLEKSTCKVCETSGKTGTSVEFWPELPIFKLQKIEQIYKDLMYQRLFCLAITFPDIKFSFNGKRISVNDKKFLKMFDDNIEFTTFKNGFVGVYPNQSDEFSFFTYVNGMHMSRGGSHVEYVANQIVAPIREKLCRKYKAIKPADIKNKLTVVVFMRNFPNPKFDSQTKETLTNLPSDVSSYFAGEIDFDALAKVVLKNEAIIGPVIETFKIKEELKARRELKAVKKAKVRSDKYMGPIGSRMYLALCEGASAMSGISSCLGRNGIGYYAMRGVPLNAYDSTMQKIVANQELKDILNILGLDIAKTEGRKDIDFERVLITTDQDADGSHIAAMLIGWFIKFAPNLFDEGRICKLVTPLIILKDQKDKIVQWFFSVPEFKAWEEKNAGHKYKVVYLKGLGSWERQDLIDLIGKNGLQNFILEFRLDEDGKVYVEDWLGSDAEKRKKYLREYTFDINQA